MVVFEHNSDTNIVKYRSIGGGGGLYYVNNVFDKCINKVP